MHSDVDGRLICRAFAVKVDTKRPPVFLFSGVNLYHDFRNDVFCDLYNLFRSPENGKSGSRFVSTFTANALDRRMRPKCRPDLSLFAGLALPGTPAIWELFCSGRGTVSTGGGARPPPTPPPAPPPPSQKLPTGLPQKLTQRRAPPPLRRALDPDPDLSFEAGPSQKLTRPRARHPQKSTPQASPRRAPGGIQRRARQILRGTSILVKQLPSGRRWRPPPSRLPPRRARTFFPR